VVAASGGGCVYSCSSLEEIIHGKNKFHTHLKNRRFDCRSLVAAASFSLALIFSLWIVNEVVARDNYITEIYEGLYIELGWLN